MSLLAGPDRPPGPLGLRGFLPRLPTQDSVQIHEGAQDTSRIHQTLRTKLEVEVHPRTLGETHGLAFLSHPLSDTENVSQKSYWQSQETIKYFSPSVDCLMKHLTHLEHFVSLAPLPGGCG